MVYNSNTHSLYGYTGADTNTIYITRIRILSSNKKKRKTQKKTLETNKLTTDYTGFSNFTALKTCHCQKDKNFVP